jgi:uncharacterized protein YdhG (YjbR/CyaY superfamily)
VGTVDEYLDSLDEQDRAAFARVRDLALQVVPDAEQGTSYGVAALMVRGKPLLGFHAAAEHLALYPFSGSAVEAVRDQLAGFSLSRGTVRFTARTPLPEQAVRDLVRARRDQLTPPAS